MESYFEICKTLSLTAREAIALLIVERFCEEKSIKSHHIAEFIEYMWKYPLIQFPDEFSSWEEASPTLVNCGLGDDFPAALLDVLHNVEVSEHTFRTLIGSTVEILWASFWGAADDKLSFEFLQKIVITSQLSNFPSLTPFKFSKFHEGDGWGKERLEKEDVIFWRSMSKMDFSTPSTLENSQ